jgi:hypothetical protein
MWFPKEKIMKRNSKTPFLSFEALTERLTNRRNKFADKPLSNVLPELSQYDFRCWGFEATLKLLPPTLSDSVEPISIGNSPMIYRKKDATAAIFAKPGESGMFECTYIVAVCTVQQFRVALVQYAARTEHSP